MPVSTMPMSVPAPRWLKAGWLKVERKPAASAAEMSRGV